MEGRGMRWGWGCCVGVRGVCPPQAYRRPQVALHDLYVNDKDRQELADAALCRDRFLSWGWLGTRAHCPLLANLGLLRPPLPRFGWSVVALHDLLLYIIRTHQELDDTGTQGACGLSPWLPGMGISRLALAAGMSFWRVWVRSRKFTFCRHGVLFLHPRPTGLQVL